MTPSLLVATAVADTLVAGLIFPEFGMGGVLGCTLFDHDCGFLSEGQQEEDYGSLCYYQRLAYFSWLLIRASMLLVLVAHRVKSGREFFAYGKTSAPWRSCYGSLNSFVKGSEGRSYRVQLTCPLLPCQLPVELLDTPRVEEAKVEVSYRLSKTVLRIYLVPS